MRTRLLGAMLGAGLLVSACGSDSDPDAATAGDGTLSSDASDTTVSDLASGADDEMNTSAAADDSGDTGTDTVDSDAVEPDAIEPDAEKPEVVIPEEIPTELQRTVLVEGTGVAAENGDTVVVDYVGVRSRDGVEFDASYGGDTFPVTLGDGGVIQGWEQGLVGSQTDERVQLDIPSDLAYGPSARGELIGENEALTFVIDVRAVIPEVTPDEVPTEPGVPLSEGATETTAVDLVEGEGRELEEGQTALLRIVNFRGDNGVAIQTEWTPPQSLPYVQNKMIPGLYEGLAGIRVGGRRAITIPPADGFGEEGAPQQGLPAGADMIVLVELAAIF